MSMRADYVRLAGGLDLVQGALAVQPGRLSECQNFEQIFGSTGYRRIDGYERFDGQAAPSEARYHVLSYLPSGSEPLALGAQVRGASAVASVALVEDDPDAPLHKRLVLASLEGEFVDGESLLLVLGGALGDVAGPAQLGAEALFPKHAQYLQAASTLQRNAIGTVPGAGKVLGVAVYLGNVYALRNSASQETAALWRSTPTGWQAVREGLLPSGAMVTDVANFTGSAADIALFGCDGMNRPWRYDGAKFEFMPAIYGTQATSTTSLSVATGERTFVVQQSARAWKVGDTLLAHSTANAGNRMIGLVVSYATATGTLVLNVAQVLGSGTFADWEIGAAGFSDKPGTLLAHRDHLFLGYPLGQLQTSNTGDPMAYTTTAQALGMGDKITGLASLRGAALGVFCSGKISILSGSTALDWALAPHSQTSGARMGTVQEVSGSALFLDDRGLTCLQATQKFGGFEPSIFSREIKPMLDQLSGEVVASRLCKSKFQYRLYFRDGTVLTASILSPNAELTPADVSFTRQLYPDAPTCTAQGKLAGGAEGLFFGTADGFVMHEDTGTSFDGKPIESVLRLHFNQLKSPASKKRFHKLSLEMQSPSTVDIRFRQQFDLDDGQYKSSITRLATAWGGGGLWDASRWEGFYWSRPTQTMAEANIDGVGKSMGFLLWHESAIDQPFTLQGLLLQYSIIGLSR